MLLLPNVMEAEQDFRARFIADPLMSAAFPEEIERTLLSGAAFRERELVNASPEGWPKRYECRHIVPGLAGYDDMKLGTVLIDRDALDNMRASFAGKPVYDHVHPATTSTDDFKNGKAVGIVTKSWHNPDDGWDWAEFYVWDPVAQRHCESSAYAVSNTYVPTDRDKSPGLRNNVPYDWKVINGQYRHLAIVPNPRYEGARIVICNSQGGSPMKLFGMFKGKKDELDSSKTVEVGGKQVALKDLIEVHNAKAAAAASSGEQMPDDAVVEIDGKEVKLADLKAGFSEHQNALDAKAKADAEKKKTDDETKATELANAKKAEDERLAKEKTEKEKNFKEIENARLTGTPTEPVISTRREQAAEGAKRYGSSK